MKKLIFPLLAGAALFAASCKTGGGGDTVDLRLKLTPGLKYAYTMDTKMKMEQQATGQKIAVDNDMKMVFNYDVTAADSNSNTINVSYDQIKMDMKSPMMNMSYDSKDTNGKAGPLAIMGGMIGKTFSMTVNSKGEITALKGFDEMMSSMAEGAGADAAAMATMKQQFNDSSFRQMMQQSLNIFPDAPVHVGDTWKRTTNGNMQGMNSKMDNTYKLLSVADGVAHIDVDTKIAIDGTNAAAAAQGVKMDISGTQKGTMDVEVATGLVKESNMKQNISGKMNAMGMEIPITMNSDVKITGKKL